LVAEQEADGAAASGEEGVSCLDTEAYIPPCSNTIIAMLIARSQAAASKIARIFPPNYFICFNIQLF
jgi:hypothetical protein